MHNGNNCKEGFRGTLNFQKFKVAHFGEFLCLIWCCIIIFIVTFFHLFYCDLCFQDIVIQQDDEIRLRIVGTRVDANDIVSATIL